MRLFLQLLIVFATFNEAASKAGGFRRIGSPRSERVKYGNANQTLHQLINMEPIEKFVIRSPRYENATKYGIALLVISADYEIALRKEIREQWAAVESSNSLKAGEALVIFLVGRSSLLDEEAATYGDLLQVDIEETYRNLVYKIEAGFLWLKKHVESEFVAKIDSDTVVHIDRLHATLKRYEIEYKSDNFLVCSSIWGAGPIRDEYSAWYTSYNDFSGWRFPDYCNGPGYVMSRPAFAKIVEKMKEHKVLEVEDVFFTGVVAKYIVDKIDSGVVATEYTTYSNCDVHGPARSILCTHHQFRYYKYKKDLTAAWTTLQTPNCYYPSYYRFMNFVTQQ